MFLDVDLGRVALFQLERVMEADQCLRLCYQGGGSSVQPNGIHHFLCSRSEDPSSLAAGGSPTKHHFARESGSA